jgi:hypothetical protein
MAGLEVAWRGSGGPVTATANAPEQTKARKVVLCVIFSVFFFGWNLRVGLGRVAYMYDSPMPFIGSTNQSAQSS